MMRNSIIVVMLSLLVSSPIVVHAQGIKQGNVAMKEFVRLNNTGGNKAQMYKALYTSYTSFLSVINSQNSGNSYNEARENIKILYPYFQNAAGYYSQNNNQRMAMEFAKACIDIPKHNAFRGEQFSHDSYYPTIVYFTASNAYNDEKYQDAIRYYNEYLKTGETAKRKNAYGYLYRACVKVKNTALASNVMSNAVASYPNDFDILSMAINAAIDAKDYHLLSGYLDKALRLRPDNQDLLSIQGQMYEEKRDYENALKVFTRMRQLNPNSMSITEHVALNTYNIGVTYYNKAALESNAATAKRLRKQSTDYFLRAQKVLSEILQSDPTSLKYTQALAIAYSCTGNQKQLDATNFKLHALGGGHIAKDATPALVGFSDRDAMGASNNNYASASPLPSSTNEAGDGIRPSDEINSQEIPKFSVYAQKRISNDIKKWQAKDPYETVAEYKKRVNERTQKEKVRELQKEAEQEYIKMYSHTPRYDEMRLMPYDAENQVFLIRSFYGDMVLPVSRERNEAKIFESNWNGMQFKDAQYYIDGDSLCLASLTFVTPTGNNYKYDNQKALEYVETNVDVNLAQIDYSKISSNSGGGNRSKIGKKKITIGTSDVDTGIPQSKSVNNNSFAVIISNEDYQQVASVPMANNDGEVFAKYCRQTLGMPESNVRTYTNATLGSMINAVQDIRNIADAYSGDIQVIFYYAGHGIPDEATKDAYLLPVDADGKQMAVCYSLKKLYGELSSLNAKNVVVFLDACFSGTTSSGGTLMASARGVALKPKKEAPQGNMVVFSAASDAETAYPYEDMGHGMFTYFLLKKLQESKGNATLKELGDYIMKNVKEKSVVINRKPQTPTVTASVSVSDVWQNMKLK